MQAVEGQNKIMAPVDENLQKKREAGNKRCLTLDEKIKILDENKKKKMSCKNYRIGKTQAANILKEEKKLREEYENFQGKGFKHIKKIKPPEV